MVYAEEAKELTMILEADIDGLVTRIESDIADLVITTKSVEEGFMIDEGSSDVTRAAMQAVAIRDSFATLAEKLSQRQHISNLISLPD